MAAASLPRNYNVTIVAEHLLGNFDTKEWASPYAGTIWVGIEDAAGGSDGIPQAGRHEP